jgi:hypothetical protein
VLLSGCLTRPKLNPIVLDNSLERRKVSLRRRKYVGPANVDEKNDVIEAQSDDIVLLRPSLSRRGHQGVIPTSYIRIWVKIFIASDKRIDCCFKLNSQDRDFS